MTLTAIVDSGSSNLDSVRRALEVCGARIEVASDPEPLARADRIVLPGVGAFPDAMAALRDRGLVEPLRRAVLDDGVPLLGICLGMQLLASRGTEHGETEGLGLVAGSVVRLEPAGPDDRVPHVGWNEVAPRYDHPLLRGIPGGADFYFVHSYHFVPADEAAALAHTPYCGGFVSAVAVGNIMGVQFHPEKSQQHGMTLLRDFLAV